MDRFRWMLYFLLLLSFVGKRSNEGGIDFLEGQPIRQIDFVCPFAGDGSRCPEFLSPMRPAPSNREKKLFVMTNKPLSPTKNACPHCGVFIKAWKENIGVLGHFRYLKAWLSDKSIREPAPQDRL